MGGEKERDEISPEVKGKVQQVAFLLKPFFFFFTGFNERRTGTKDSRYFSLLTVFLAFFFFSFHEYKSRFFPLGRKED